MARVKADRPRKGTRNHGFFPQLSGLARAIDKVTTLVPEKAIDYSADKIAAAEAKRQRKMDKAKPKKVCNRNCDCVGECKAGIE